MDERKVAESTANAYINSLYQLNERKPFKNLAFLKKVDEIDKIISGYADSTQRALLATVVSTLSLVKEKAGFKKTYKHFYDKMMERTKAVRETEDKHEKTDKQKENWVSWEEIEKRKNELGEEIAKFNTKKALSASEYEKTLQHIVLCLYTDIQPRRNQDYLDMYIVKKWNDKMPTDKNYLDMTGHKFIYNKYKTAKKYGRQEIDIPESLQSCINVFLKHHPLWKGMAKRKTEPVKFLVSQSGEPLTAVNAITRLLNKVFGKKIGSSMIRHIYISDKYKGVMEEQAKDAANMGHSMELQREYFKKDDEESA
jgi:hypothetical protein